MMKTKLNLVMDTLLISMLYLEAVQGFIFSSNPKTRECPEVGNYKFTNAAPYDNMALPQCFVPVFSLFNRETTYEFSKGINFTAGNIPSSYSPSKETIFLAHGFRDFPLKKNQWMIKTTKNLLEKFDFNVIFLIWYEHSPFNYKQSAANTRVAARGLYDLVKVLYNKGLSRQKAYCVGHSLGAHICGYAGQYLGGLKFGRITGLDPAGPEFKDIPANARLSKEDAEFVDIIHTNGDTTFLIGYFVDYGFPKPLGHVDFYPNGGKKQPGCSNKRRLSRSIDHFVDASDRDTLDELVGRLKKLVEKEEKKEYKEIEFSSKEIETEKELSSNEITNIEVDKNTHNIKEEWKKYLESANNEELEALYRIAKGDTFTNFLGCSHRRASDYYYESIKVPCAATNDCTSQGPDNIAPDCPQSAQPYPQMGYYAADDRNIRGLFYVHVTETTPYCVITP